MSGGPIYINFFSDEPLLPMNQIEENLYLGNLEAARDRDLLQEKGITHVLSILDTFRYMERFEGFEYMQIEMPDFPNANILQHVPQALSFISNSLKQGKILVHCAAGVSRSASIVIAYIMVKNEYNFNTAKDFVKSKRSCIWPNPGFQRQISSIKHGDYIQYLT